MKIAIIGAGLSGLVLAQRLSAAHQVTVFEKARGAGGRMSTRRAEPFAFDHGAQYFTAETERFQSFLKPYEASGLVAPWPHKIELVGGAQVSSKPKWVVAPAMNALCKQLAQTIDLQTQFHVSQLVQENGKWKLSGKDGAEAGPFDWVISTAPAPQTEALFPEAFADYAAFGTVKMSGCFALMLGFDSALDLSWTALKSATPPIGWMAVNSEKPGRGSAMSLLIQSSNEWAEAHLEDAPEQVTQILTDAASEIAGQDLSHAAHSALHRWRYAATPQSAQRSFFKDQTLQLAVCGDWCAGSKVEAAFTSASSLADTFEAA